MDGSRKLILETQLLQLRDEGRKVRERYETLEQELYRGDAEYNIAQAEVMRIDEQLRENERTRPSELGFPAPGVLANWEVSQKKLRAALQDAIAARNTVRDARDHARREMNKAAVRLEELMRMERNLVNAISEPKQARTFA